ncbi:MAG: hypothetical protein AAB467_01105 [Patescibacteria group bacterium]
MRTFISMVMISLPLFVASYFGWMAVKNPEMGALFVGVNVLFFLVFLSVGAAVFRAAERAGHFNKSLPRRPPPPEEPMVD